MERIKRSTVTDTLLEVLEHADEIEHVLVVYQRKEEIDRTKGDAIGIYTNDDAKLADRQRQDVALWSFDERVTQDGYPR